MARPAPIGVACTTSACRGLRGPFPGGDRPSDFYVCALLVLFEYVAVSNLMRFNDGLGWSWVFFLSPLLLFGNVLDGMRFWAGNLNCQLRLLAVLCERLLLIVRGSL